MNKPSAHERFAIGFAAAEGVPRERYLPVIEVLTRMPAMSVRRAKLSDQIRRAIDASKLSRYRICKKLGIGESTMSRFMNRKGGLSMEKIDALADLLGLSITTKRKSR